MRALIAGRGALPAALVAALDAPPLICALADNPPDTLEPDLTFRLETLGSLLLTLGQRGVREICLCGAIDRPVLDMALLDAETAPLVPLFQEALSKGDDGALRLVMDLFERTGFTILAAHEIAPGLLMPAGVPTARAPRRVHKEDATKGAQVLAELGRADQGQACVIRKGRVLAREDARGTDAMLADLGGETPPEGIFDARGLSREGKWWLERCAHEAPDRKGAGAILFKGPKPEQDRRSDLPAIGPETVLRGARAGLEGLVIEAEGVIVLDQPGVVAALDAASMFLWVRP